MRQHQNKAATLLHEITSQTQAGSVKQNIVTTLKASKLTSEHAKINILLHVFEGQGKRGVLDLSLFASQHFRSVSEDLKN